MAYDSPLIESQASQLGRALNDTGPNTGPLAGILNANKVHLGQSNLAITPTTTYATLSGQEAGFGGYTAQSLVWDVPSTAADGTVEVASTPVVFRPTDSSEDDSIYNIWVSDSGSAVWHLAGVIQGGPLPMGTALDQMIVTLRFRPATNSLVAIIA
jgi:hypothetical protein